MLFFGLYVLIEQIYISLCTRLLDVFFPLYFRVVFFVFLYVFTCFSERMSVFLASNFLTSTIKESNVLYRFRTWYIRVFFGLASFLGEEWEDG